MADELEAYLAKRRGAAPAAAADDDDPLAAYLAKRRAPPPPTDMGPEARRARAGMAPSPKRQTAEEAGTMSGPLRVEPVKMSPNLAGIGPDVVNIDTKRPLMEREALSPEEQKALPARDAAERGDMVRFLGTTGAGAVAGRAVGGAMAAGAPRLAPIAEGAVGGGTTLATDTAARGGTAGDVAKAFGTGAAAGGAVAAVPQAVEAVATGVSKVGRSLVPALGPGAAERVQERTHRNLTEPVGQRVADKVGRALGEEGERMAPVLDRNPHLRRSLAIDAADNPEAALNAVTRTKAVANAHRAADFERMQAYHADKPPSSQATIAGVLDDYDAALLRDTADLDRYKVLSTARNEVQQLGDRLRKAQGLPPAVNGDYSGTVISPMDLRSLEQTIGRRAYEMGTPTSVKAKVNRELYAPLARQVNALADATPGVNAKRFADGGHDISVLIPVEESLQANVKSIRDNRPTWREMAKQHAGKVASFGTTGGIVTGIAMHEPAMIAAAATGAAAMAAHKIAGKVARRVDFRIAEAHRNRGAAAPARPRLDPVETGPTAEGLSARQADEERRKPGIADLY